MQSRVLQFRRAEDLRSVGTSDLSSAYVSQDEFEHMLKLVNGFWIHNGDPSAPHAELTSGKCSNGFINALLLLKFPNICWMLADDMVADYRSQHLRAPDWVVGSDHAAATLSYEVAKGLGAKHGFTEKRMDASGKKFQDWKREIIASDELVLQTEELVSTTSTLEQVREGIAAGHEHTIRFADVSLCLVHRSPDYQFAGQPIVFRYHYDIEQWEPADCPLCASGSKPLRPKQHWAELTQAA
jgi:orotate phosphoribosyltransferase